MDKRSVVAALLGCSTAALLGFSLPAGGGACVVGPDGRKLFFSEDQLQAAYAQSQTPKETYRCLFSPPAASEPTQSVAVLPADVVRKTPGKRQTSPRKPKGKW